MSMGEETVDVLSKEIKVIQKNQIKIVELENNIGNKKLTRTERDVSRKMVMLEEKVGKSEDRSIETKMKNRESKN